MTGRDNLDSAARQDGPEDGSLPPDGATDEGSSEKSAAKKRGAALRRTLRALHRDAGYLVVGLTFVYALSGIAVNHVEDWDPSFAHFEHTHQVTLPAGADQDATVAAVLSALEIEEIPVEVYEASETELDVVLDRRTLHVDLRSGEVFEEGQEPRFLLRAANWLHLNRGKAAWTYVADGFAVLLLFLATSGLFMLPGRKGLLGRGGILVLIGAAVPVLYVLLS